MNRKKVDTLRTRRGKRPCHELSILHAPKTTWLLKTHPTPLPFEGAKIPGGRQVLNGGNEEEGCGKGHVAIHPRLFRRRLFTARTSDSVCTFSRGQKMSEGVFFFFFSWRGVAYCTKCAMHVAKSLEQHKKLKVGYSGTPRVTRASDPQPLHDTGPRSHPPFVALVPTEKRSRKRQDFPPYAASGLGLGLGGRKRTLDYETCKYARLLTSVWCVFSYLLYVLALHCQISLLLLYFRYLSFVS